LALCGHKVALQSSSLYARSRPEQTFANSGPGSRLPEYFRSAEQIDIIESQRLAWPAKSRSLNGLALAYAGQGDTIRERAPNAKDITNKKGSRNRPLSDGDKSKNKTKSKVRAKVEHPFLVLKRVFGFSKVRYRGLEKNAARLFVACVLVNLHMVRSRLLPAT
jgi:hypothetical protein